MRLLIARHGETIENVMQLSSGQNDAKLTSRSRREALALGYRLDALGVEHVMASDLPRVKETVSIALPTAGMLSQEFFSRGARTFEEATAIIQKISYGRNSDRANAGLVLLEGRGTCSTKHALLASLAEELGIDVQLIVGIYRMTGANTPGIGEVLAASGLEAIF